MSKKSPEMLQKEKIALPKWGIFGIFNLLAMYFANAL